MLFKHKLRILLKIILLDIVDEVIIKNLQDFYLSLYVRSMPNFRFFYTLSKFIDYIINKFALDIDECQMKCIFIKGTTKPGVCFINFNQE